MATFSFFFYLSFALLACLLNTAYCHAVDYNNNNILELPSDHGSRAGKFVGRKTEIRNVESDTVVQKLGKFSVEEFNRRTQLISEGNRYQSMLVFREVVRAQRQVVSGLKYYLKIDVALDNEKINKSFDAVVVVKPWMRSKQLLSFAPSHDY